MSEQITNPNPQEELTPTTVVTEVVESKAPQAKNVESEAQLKLLAAKKRSAAIKSQIQSISEEMASTKTSKTRTRSTASSKVSKASKEVSKAKARESKLTSDNESLANVATSNTSSVVNVVNTAAASNISNSSSALNSINGTNVGSHTPGTPLASTSDPLKAQELLKLQEIQYLAQKRAKLKMAIATLQAEHKAWSTFNAEAKYSNYKAQALEVSKANHSLATEALESKILAKEIESSNVKSQTVEQSSHTKEQESNTGGSLGIEYVNANQEVKQEINKELKQDSSAINSQDSQQNSYDSFAYSPWFYRPMKLNITSTESCKDYEAELQLFERNLVSDGCVSAVLARPVASLLYAVRYNSIPILSIGPGIRELAMSFSASIYGSGFASVVLGHDFDPSFSATLEQFSEKVILIENIFGRGWSDSLLNSTQRTSKVVIFAHPYIDDITIEPQGISNYIWPLINDCYIEYMPRDSFIQGLRMSTFQKYERTGNVEELELKESFAALKLSRFAYKRIETVLYDTKQLYLFNTQEQESEREELKEIDLEVIFALLPFALISKKLQVLQELLEKRRQDLSPHTIAMVEQYLP